VVSVVLVGGRIVLWGFDGWQSIRACIADFGRGKQLRGLLSGIVNGVSMFGLGIVQV